MDNNRTSMPTGNNANSSGDNDDDNLKQRPDDSAGEDAKEEAKEDKEDDNDLAKAEAEDEEKLKKEQSANKAIKGVGKALANVKETLMSMVKILKLIIKFVKFLISLGFVGIIILVVIIIIILLMVLCYSFTDDSSNGQNSQAWRSNYDSQDLISQDRYEYRSELRKEMQEVQSSVLEGMSDSEKEELRNQILNYNDSLSSYGSELMSLYDAEAGYQIINQDATILLLLERLTYAYTYTDWEPDYDINGEKEKEIEELKNEIAEEDARPEDEKEWSALETRRKKQDLASLEQELGELELKIERYLELNKGYNEKYKTKFFVDPINSKVSPDGTALEDKVVSYFKDKYGVETEEVKEELSYFHTIVTRTFTYKKVITGGDCSELNSFLAAPSYTQEETQEETDSGVSLQEIEEPYKVKFEIMHHEATLRLIKYEEILNDLFGSTTGVLAIKEALSNHMPIFEYATYSQDIINKTFYDYELYDPAYFDEEGRYVFDSTFNEKLNKYTSSSDTDIDFSKVESRAQEELLLEQYKGQLSQQERSSKPDKILIEELKGLIGELEDKLKNEPTSEELRAEYQENYANVLKKSINQEADDRIYDPHNHNVIVDSASYYFPYGNNPVDNYNERISIEETLLSECDRSGSGKYTTSGWGDVSSGVSVDECEREIVATIDTTSTQTSLKPLKIRSLLNSADYAYTKTEMREVDAEKVLSEARENTKWQRRRVIYTSEKGVTSEAGYDYRKVTTATINNYGSVIGSVTPWESNDEIDLNNQTFLTDFYGQTELITEEYSGDTPGTIAQPGNEHYDAASVSIVYYNQGEYPGQNYGKSTIAATGCGPSSLAMVVDSLTNSNVGVVGMCDWAFKNGYKVDGSGSKWSLIPDGAKAFGLSVNGIPRTDKDAVVAALSNKHPVVMICGPGDFTSSGHFIVLTGIDSSGNVSVNDPGSKARTGQKWPINTIMTNASSKSGSSAVTFWEIY